MSNPDAEFLLTVICTVYNHEKYLKKTIEGFLMQKTSFNFQVIIHDDASTDHSADIIRSYEQKYPHLIRAIYQTENQYTKGIDLTSTHILPIARGKYQAICEGDDYWTNPNKLENQVSYLESHPECMLVATAGQLCFEDGVLMDTAFRPFIGNRIVPIDEVASRWLFPTASLVYRSELCQKPIPFAEGAPCGDVPLVLHAAINGTVYYIDDITCVYRRGADASLTNQWSKNPKLAIDINDRFIKMLDSFDEYTNSEYSAAIDRFRKQKEFNNLLLKQDMHSIREKRYDDYYGRASIKRKCIIILRVRLPKLVALVENVVEDIRYKKCKRKYKQQTY